MRAAQKLIAAACGALPIALFAFSAGGPIRRTGAPADGGQDCSSCHSPGNSGAAGSISIATAASTYTPSAQQMLQVTVKDPQAVRWGFQLTARSVNNPSVEAGTFAPVDATQVKVQCDDGSTNGSPAPCNGAREFAEQATAPQTATGAGFTFQVLWTPPAQEVGAITLYASGVAANGDGQPTGDHTYTTSVTLTANAACNNTTRPTLQKVVDAASFSQTSTATGGLWSIFGLNFALSGTARNAGPGDFVSGAFPTTLACVSVLVNNQPAAITYVSPAQINLQAPNVPAGTPATVTVVTNAGKQNELRSDVGTISVPAVAPAFFTFNGTSIAADFGGTANPVANPSVVSTGKPAKPGDIITLWGTGFGPTNPAVAPGAIDTGVANVTGSVGVTIGGVALTSSDILYAGLSPQSISGLYQLNVRIPSGVPNGDVPVTVTINGIASQSGATIPINSGQ